MKRLKTERGQSMADFVRQQLASARESIRAGDLAGAESRFREILARDPAHHDSLYALGRLALQSGRNEEAIPLLRKSMARPSAAPQCHADLAVAFQNLGRNDEAATEARLALLTEPTHLSALNTLGNALRALGRLDEATDCFRSAVRLNPDVAVIHLNLASALRDAGLADEALGAYARAIDLAPGNADAHLLMGTLLRSLGRSEEAEQELVRALEIRPTHAEALNALGNLQLDQGRPEAAERSYRRALEARPRYVEALYNLGNLLRASRRLDQAREAYAAAAALKPDFADAHARLAQTCSELGLHEAALERFSIVVALRPEQAEAHGGRGNALRALARFDEAEAAYRSAVEVQPDLAEGQCNLSTVYLDLGMPEPAIDHARRAIAARPDLAEAHWNLAQAFLTQGDLTRGWPKYDYRLTKKDAAELPFPYPLWNGELLGERTLLVTAEQGVGDEIMFASCLPDLLRESTRCVVECDARLVPLFARSFPAAKLIGRLRSVGEYPAELPKPECRIAAGSLPKLYRGDLDRFPRTESYLVPDPEKVAAWRHRYDALGPGLKVGISWRGGKEPLVQRARSIPLVKWSGLAAAGPIHLVNLQYGETEAERSAARRESGLEVHDWEDADPLADLDGFAAQIAALDLVISVDNSTVHMAGAVGTPTWVLLPSVADWRWMRDREDTPWYPALRLFRQRRAGEWDEVFARALEALEERAAQGGGSAADRAPGNRPGPGADRATAPGGQAHGGEPRVTAPASLRARTPWVALLNDTTYWYHWGCTATSTAIVRTLEERGYALNRVPISGLHGCGAGPAKLEDFDDPAFFQRYRAANPWVFRELDDVDHVVINGEGSLHGLSPYVSNLLYLAYASKVHLGKRVQIVNHSCYPESVAAVDDSPIWRVYRKVYGAMDHVAVREPVSLDLLARAGVTATQAFDCLPLHVAGAEWPPSVRRQNEIVIAGSVAMRETDVQAWAKFVERMVARGRRVRCLIGANMFPAEDERTFARLLEQRAPRSFEVVEAGSMAVWLDVLAGAAAVVSGRFHHTIAAAALDTPFVLLESNTPKNAGLARMLHATPPIPLDSPRLVEEMVSRAEEALERGRRSPDSPGALLAELCGLAMNNFRELPAVTS